MNTGIRRYKRYAVEHIDMHAKALLTTEAELQNLSMTGVCITTRKSLKLGEKHLVTLKGGGVALPLECSVVWERISGSVKTAGGDVVPVYTAGLTFRETGSDKIIKLKDFIRGSGVAYEQKLSDEYGPSSLRFKLYGNEKAVLYYPQTSTVKKVSLGGMLVELFEKIELEKRFPMALFLPGDHQPLRVRGRVASCIRMSSEHSKHFDVGIEFLDMREEDRGRLQTFLHSLEGFPVP